jgi:hypothetical protein
MFTVTTMMGDEEAGAGGLGEAHWEEEVLIGSPVQSARLSNYEDGRQHRSTEAFPYSFEHYLGST